jgi:hypothetical protein
VSDAGDPLAELARRLHRFEPTALLRALAEAGVDFERLRFDSHLVSALRAAGEFFTDAPEAPGASDDVPPLTEGGPYLAPHPQLFHALRRAPRSQGGAEVELTLNLGLLSGRSPIPSYFLKYFTSSDVQQPLFELLRLLDHALLRDRVAALAAAERNEPLRAAGGRLALLGGVATPCFVDWLFRRVFPELRVAVARDTSELPVATGRAAVGYSELGATVLGGGALARDGAVEVTLATDEDTFGERSWRSEAERRVRAEILERLRSFDLTLRVVLLSFAGSVPGGPSIGRAEVGFDALAAAPVPRRSLVFVGSLAAR